MIELATVWTPGSLVSAIVGGALFGVLLAQFANPRFDPIESGLLGFALAVLAGGIFYAGQAVDTFSGKDGAVLGWRVVSRFGEWILFSAAISVGLALALRWRSGAWRADAAEDLDLPPRLIDHDDEAREGWR